MLPLPRSPVLNFEWGAMQEYDWPGGWTRLIVIHAEDSCAALIIQEVYSPQGPIEVFNCATDLCIGVASAANVDELSQKMRTPTEGTEQARNVGGLRAMLRIRKIAPQLEWLIDEAQTERGKQRIVGWASHPKGSRALRLLKPLGFETHGPATVRHVKHFANSSKHTQRYKAPTPWVAEGPQSRTLVERAGPQRPKDRP